MKKMLNRFFLPLLGLLFAGTLSVAAASDVKAPDALVKDVTNEVLEIVRADKAIQAGDTKRVIELVDAKVLPHFDFRRMTMLAVGRDWRQASPEQQGKLTDAFRTLLVRTYSNALTQYRDQRIVFPLSRFAAADTRVQIRSPRSSRPARSRWASTTCWRRASRAGKCSTSSSPA